LSRESLLTRQEGSYQGIALAMLPGCRTFTALAAILAGDYADSRFLR